MRGTISLNESQRQAATLDPSSALLVVAGPGSGKTRTIVERVKHLISHHKVKPSELLCLTFSDKAAEEMRNRIEKEVGTAEVETSTFHAFCLGVLEDSVFETGVSYKSGLISRTNQLVWGLRNIDNFGFESIEIGNNAVEVIESIIDGISAFRDELVTPIQLKEYVVKKRTELVARQQQATAGQSSGRKLGKQTKNEATGQEEIDDQIAFVNQLADLYKVYERYEQFKRKESLIDYDDMIQIVVDLFRKKPEVLRRYQQRYSHVLVDEFQDNNYSQLELVKLLRPEGHVTAVGDDDQSIYRFRGAYLTIFEDFKRHYGQNAKVVKLEQNYRSTKNVVALAKQLLDQIPDREPKDLYSNNEDGGHVVVARCSTDAAEVDYVIRKIRDELLGKELRRRDGTVSPITYKDIAILSRRRFEGIKFARSIRAQGLPCTFIGETRIFSMPVVRDLIAYLKVANDPLANGIELARIMMMHGMSEKDIKIINHEARLKSRALAKRVDQIADNAKPSRNDDYDGNRNFGTDFVYAVMEDIATRNSSTLEADISNANLVNDIYQQTRRIIDSRNKKPLYEFVYDLVMVQTDIYRRMLKGNTAESEKGRIVLNEFLQLVQEFEAISKKATLKDLLNHIDMMSDFDIETRQRTDSAPDAIVITTIHQSKGKEFPIVFVVDVAARKLPMQFREKKFYCPSELSHSFRAKQLSEREIFLQEERRLLYVAMTRAQHHLFLTNAEMYGDNTTKTKPSQFLIDLDVENNPLVNFIQYDAEVAMPLMAATDSRVEQIKQEYQLLVTKFIEQMQLTSALEKLIELAIIAHHQSGKPLADFNLENVLPKSFFEKAAIDGRKEAIEVRLRDDHHASLIDVDNIHFSASALKTYQECPLRYKFSYILEVPKLTRTYFDLGTAVHSVVEGLTRRQIAEKGYMPTLEDASALLDKYWVSNSYQSITQEQEDRKSAEQMLRYFVNWCSERKALGCTPVSAEQTFELTVGSTGKKLIGFIDRIDITPSGDYEVFDYKTGKSMLSGNTIRKDIQVNAYSLAVQALYGKLPSTANLLYVRKEKPIVYEVTEEGVGQSRQEMASLVNGILAEQFEPTPSFRTCKFCDYKNICEAKETEGED